MKISVYPGYGFKHDTSVWVVGVLQKNLKKKKGKKKRRRCCESKRDTSGSKNW